MNGVLLIDKPEGCTSHDVVDEVRKIFKTEAVGHAGTLDPLATGLLVMLLGDATKLSQYLMDSRKLYRVRVLLGTRTDSGDITGQVIEEKPVPDVTEEMLDRAMKDLVGSLMLSVPIYSAVKVNGKKLYEYARNKQDVGVPVRTMRINHAQVIERTERELVVDVDCEKGTFVRSWVEKLGECLGTCATVKELRRVGSGHFDVKDALTLQQAAAQVESGAILSTLIPLKDVLVSWPMLKVLGRDQRLLQNGQIPNGVYSQLMHFKVEKGVRMIDDRGGLLALVVPDPKKGVRLAKVFGTH